MNRKTIWQEKQNKPSYIVDDLDTGGDADIIYKVLLRRGVFKWFSARHKLIKLKNIWRDRITMSILTQKYFKDEPEMVWYERGYRKALEECRAEVREICHGERWEAPENDRRAQRWLKEYEKREVIDE